MAANSNAAAILYDSQNFLLDSAGDTPGNVLNRSARAEGRKARTLMVEGTAVIQASTWTLGNEIRMGLRIGAFSQNPVDGNIETDVNYAMFANSASIQTEAGVFANDKRSNKWTYWHYMHFATGNEQSLRVINIRTKANAYLDASECLALYLELHAGSVGIRYQLMLRTLVVDEG